MSIFISFLLALRINFLIPEIPEKNRSIVINQKYLKQLGFPYQYFPDEILTDEEVNYRIQVIYVSFTMYFTVASFGIPTLGPVVGQVLLPLPPLAVEKLVRNQLHSQTQNTAQTAPVVRSKVDKVKLTTEQIEILKKCIDGSITLEEAIFQLRSGAGITDLAAITGFIILVNWFDSLHGKDYPMVKEYIYHSIFEFT